MTLTSRPPGKPPAWYQPVRVLRRAARNYLDQLAVQSLTRQINAASSEGPRTTANAAAAARGCCYLVAQDYGW